VPPSSAVLSVVDGREAEVLGRLAGHAKIRAGWLAATADQQFSWSPNAGPYESCGHAESGSQTVDDDIRATRGTVTGDGGPADRSYVLLGAALSRVATVG
jgi:hypothetical protein